MAFDPILIEQARREISGASFGGRTAKAAQWAELLGVTPKTIYRMIGDPARRRERRRPARRPEYHSWARIVFEVKKRPPEEAGELSTEDALALALRQGLVPQEAAQMPVATINAIARQTGWTKRESRAVRFQAGRPNQAHHFDASTSKYFYIARSIDGGTDYLLRLHRPAKHYKNKPVPVDALRPWIYGLVDDHSGRWTARYVAARGENSGDSMSFLAWAWAEIGLPEQLLADQGMLKKALPSRDLIDRLGIELPEMMPYEKRGHGKIEKPWSTCWLKFELPFFSVIPDWSKVELTLSELNAQLGNYIEHYNRLPHRFERDITRMQAWNRVNLHGGIVRIPENALATAAGRAKRKVGVDGTLEYLGRTFEVKGLHDAWVWVFKGVFEDRLVAQDIDTGKKYEVEEFAPLDLGEFRAHPETPHEKLLKTGAELPLTGRGLYAEREDSGQAGMTEQKVIAMPIKTKEERQIEDPFDVEHFATLDEAMREFFSIVGTFITPEERKEVERLLVENRLLKSYVRDLALEIRGAIEVRRQAAG